LILSMLREDIRKRRTKIWKKIIIVSSSLFWGEEYVCDHNTHILYERDVYIYIYNIYIYINKKWKCDFSWRKRKTINPSKRLIFAFRAFVKRDLKIIGKEDLFYIIYIMYSEFQSHRFSSGNRKNVRTFF